MQRALSNYLDRRGLITKLLSVSASCISVGKLCRRTRATYIEGVGISDNHGEIDWKQVTPDKTGKSFLIVKSTEGATYQDPNFLKNFASATAAGFRPGACHVLRFDSSSPSDQMNNFLNQIKVAERSVGPIQLSEMQPFIALDVGEHKEDDYSLVRNVIEESVRYLKDQANVTPYIYTKKAFWDAHVAETPDIVKECPLWITRWSEEPPSENELPRGWSRWKIWQYSDKGQVLGIRGVVDLNRLTIEMTY